LLVGLLAAPQDSLFCVGDEDQCIYAWRRATVERIIELDQVYPGLERHALIHNYRCGRRITAASRRLIKHNLVRFRKPLVAGAREKGKIVAVSCPDRRQGAELAAYLISDAPEGSAVVLARTSRLLKEILEAGRRLGYGIPAVELATIHAAKGREWDRVILYGVDEGQTPHGKSVTGDELEAERRLFYVALTRAKLRLEVICTTGRVSRFLKEAGIRPRPL
nr:3'-5' exonuclease [Candidatus Krumholzibacteria bacterium]